MPSKSSTKKSIKGWRGNSPLTLFLTIKNHNQLKSVLFHELEKHFEPAQEHINGMDVENETSHGLIIHACINQKHGSGIITAESPEPSNPETDLILKARIWGNERDLSDMLYSAAKQDKDLNRLISGVAIRLAIDKVEAQQKRGGIIKANKTIIRPGGNN